MDVGFEELLKRYGLTSSSIAYEPRKEIFPSERSVAVVADGERHLKRLKWGFLPEYAKKPIINARSETVFEKRLFREAALENRCLIPAKGYFEWEQTEDGKRKRTIGDREGAILSLGGICKEFMDNNGDLQLCFAILTRDALPEISRVHHRMPVIIERDNEDMWLNAGNNEINALRSMMLQYDKRLKVE